MKFKEFKKEVIEYFYSINFVKRKYIKKSLKFKKYNFFYTVDFTFNGKNRKIYYHNDNWIVSTYLACYFKTLKECYKSFLVGENIYE